MTFKSFVTFLLLLTALHARGCFILFSRDANHVLVGNHEDWIKRDGAIRIIPPVPGKYGSIIFTFASEGWAQGGMNEKGLFFDAARTPYQEIVFDAKSVKAESYIWQLLLDKASTVSEALALLKGYELPALSEVTIMLADATGNAVLIGVHNQRLDIRPVSGNWLMQTNFNQWQPELSDERVCWRYNSAEKYLHEHATTSVEDILAILKKTHQDSLTVYSNIYDLKNKVVYTYNHRNFDKPITVSLPDFFSYGDCLLPLDSLEKDAVHWNDCKGNNNRRITIRGKVVDEQGVPLQFVNIGVPGKNAGTLSDPDGSFEIQLPSSIRYDSLHFSFVGLSSKRFVINSIMNTDIVVKLEQLSTRLKEVTVSAKKLSNKIERLGWMGGKDGILPLDTVLGGGAVALLLQVPSAPVHVEKLQVRLMYNSKDPLQLRLHFLDYDAALDRPGKELLTNEIILQENKRFGWLRFDLSQYDILLERKKFFVAFEWIDDRTARAKMLTGLHAWEEWKKAQYSEGNKKVEYFATTREQHAGYKYHGNMMDWPGFKELPPFTGLMIETGKSAETKVLRTFERKTSFGDWKELPVTLNAVVTVTY
jgi:hypothetical protein